MVNWVFDKSATQFNKESMIFATVFCDNWMYTYKMMKLEICLTQYKKINSGFIINLNIRPKTTKLFEENIEE